MLNRIKNQCRTLVHFPFPPLNPSKTLIFPKSSSLTPTQSPPLQPPTTPSSLSSPNDAVSSNILKLLNRLFKIPCEENEFRTRVSSLNCGQVDEIIGYLRVNDPDSAVEVFELLKNECGFKHSTVSQFVIAHILANQRRLKLLRSNFVQMLKEEGSFFFWFDLN